MPILRNRVKTNGTIKTLFKSKTLCLFQKTKLVNKVHKASDKIETKQKFFKFPRKGMGRVRNKDLKHLDKKVPN